VDKYFDESQGFTHRLWYGGGLALGFSAGASSSLFQIGVSPLIGYKITDEFSIGPRFSFLYSHYRVEDFFGNVARANLVDYGVGAFTRYKIIRNFFIHLEYGADNIESPVVPLQASGDQLVTARRLESNAFVGAGYNDGNGVWGYDIYILYNVLLAENSIRSPFDFRFGLTYNF
jgi:long-subunit fatty acid transport protein